MAVDPAQFPQPAQERRDAGSAFRIVRGGAHEHADTSHLVGLLRACRERPCDCRAAEQRDELAPPHHSITSLASASSLSGIWRPSALAVLRLMTRRNLTGCSTGRSAGLVPCKILCT